jgi:Eco57I restriction-modification methylase
MSLDGILAQLGYLESPFYRTNEEDTALLPLAHLLRDAKRARVSGTYFIRTVEGDAKTHRDRPVVHVAEANTPDEARVIHRSLWNQGTTPFLLVSLPGQVRVYTPFAYDESDTCVGEVDTLDIRHGVHDVAKHLHYLRTESIDTGEIWQTKGAELNKDRCVDRALLGNLRELTRQLVDQYRMDRSVAHALIGRFVYLCYLHQRKILSDPWLTAIDVNPDTLFSSRISLRAFRRLTDAVDDRFNGRVFPIDWSSKSADFVGAVQATAGAFAGVDVRSGQLPLFCPYDFSFIPIELLSAIYEQFLHDEGKGAKKGAFYTSEPLADYLLAEVDSVKPLERGMKVLDPCCGSGIFLVLAFRRLIEQELHRRGTHNLPAKELRQILTDSIFGVERDPEACLVTEFSLILTLLSYVDPPELHRHQRFKFPTLHNRQIFEADFFSDDSLFWKQDRLFDWIVGNPPWVELDKADDGEWPVISWLQRLQKKHPVARFRTSEAFTWRVRERLADDGVVGLLTQATTLTNDQSAAYRKAFFSQNTVSRVTNFSNLAYVLFESADEPSATIVYSHKSEYESGRDIVHFGPLVVNQPVMASRTGHRGNPWVITVCESEIQIVPSSEAAHGESSTWKRALWGNSHDHRVLKRLRQYLPRTLAEIANERGWALRLGLQLRPNEGTPENPNRHIAAIRQEQGATKTEARHYARWFSGLSVLKTPKQLRNATNQLTISEDWMVKNQKEYVRIRGGTAGLDIVRAPHLFLWNEFAAFSSQDLIFPHPKLGLSAPDGDAAWLKAVSVIWTSSITLYCLFLDLSAGWGVSRSTIDLNDARRAPMPELDPDMVSQLASLHSTLEEEEAFLDDRQKWRRRLDDGVASIVSIPPNLMLSAREFCEYRLPLVKGKAPKDLTRKPDKRQLQKYASRLKSELDAFLERRPFRHAVTILHSPTGIIAAVRLTAVGSTASARVVDAGRSDKAAVETILRSAGQKHGQWAYVRRSVRILSNKDIYICKPARRLEWTETRAILDAADIIAEVAGGRRQ